MGKVNFDAVMLETERTRTRILRNNKKEFCKFWVMKEKMSFGKFVKKLTRECEERGADFFRIINPNKLPVREWVRSKCLFGCKELTWCCPPFVNTPEETRRLLKEYKHAVLIGFKNAVTEERQKKAQLTLFELERFCFLHGYYKAFALFPGPCKLCRTCSVSTHFDKFIRELASLNEYSSLIALQSLHKKYCRQSEKARPSMEALGIDVFSALKKLGREIRIIRRRDETFLSFGLILVE